MERKNYIDNIRWIVTLILFPYHTLMVYNSFGESFYVKGADLNFTAYIIGSIWPWIMPLLFLISGIGSYYSLQKRNIKEYAKERFHRLFVPLVFGILLLVPLQTFIAEKFHNSYHGGYLKQYILFFTKPTDLSGYNGGFTPAHLWFILYLFIISMVSLPLMYLFMKRKKSIKGEKINLLQLILFFIVPVLSQVVLDISGKSMGEYLAWFLIGFFIMSNNEVQLRLQKYRIILSVMALFFLTLYGFYGIILPNTSLIIYELIYGLYSHISILAILGMGKQYLNYNNRFTLYMTKSSFGIYFLHQNWIVITAFFAVITIRSIPIQIVTILISSIVLTFLTEYTFSKIPVIRYVFGLIKGAK